MQFILVFPSSMPTMWIELFQLFQKVSMPSAGQHLFRCAYDSENKWMRVNNNDNNHSSSINNTTVIAQCSMPTHRSPIRVNAKWKVKCTNRRKMPLPVDSDTWDNSKRLSLCHGRLSVWAEIPALHIRLNISWRAVDSGESIVRMISAHRNQR